VKALEPKAKTYDDLTYCTREPAVAEDFSFGLAIMA
jgi:hypothetical protein